MRESVPDFPVIEAKAEFGDVDTVGYDRYFVFMYVETPGDVAAHIVRTGDYSPGFIGDPAFDFMNRLLKVVVDSCSSPVFRAVHRCDQRSSVQVLKADASYAGKPVVRVDDVKSSRSADQVTAADLHVLLHSKGPSQERISSSVCFESVDVDSVDVFKILGAWKVARYDLYF